MEIRGKGEKVGVGGWRLHRQEHALVQSNTRADFLPASQQGPDTQGQTQTTVKVLSSQHGDHLFTVTLAAPPQAVHEVLLPSLFRKRNSLLAQADPILPLPPKYHALLLLMNFLSISMWLTRKHLVDLKAWHSFLSEGSSCVTPSDLWA